MKVKDYKALAQKYAQQLLLMEMSDLSESIWCAGWLFGLEYIVWGFVLQRVNKQKVIFTSEDQDEYLKKRYQLHLEALDRIIELAENADGWWIGGSAATNFNQQFVSTTEWVRRYGEYLKTRQ